MGSAYAFSPFGYSGSYAGFGDTELTRSNTALKYRGDFLNFHARAWCRSAATTRATVDLMYQGRLGADFPILLPPCAGTFSMDFIGG